MKRQLYEGRGTIFFEGPVPGTMIRQFTSIRPEGDPAAATDAMVALRNRVSELLMVRMHEVDIPTQFVRRLNMREQLIHQVEPFPLLFTVRNYASDDFAARFSLPKGLKLPRPIMETYYKPSEASPATLISEEHITAFGWASPADYDTMVALALRAHDFLAGQFLACGLRLIDVTLAFGLLGHEALMDSSVVVASDMGPSCWTIYDLRRSEALDWGIAGEESTETLAVLTEVAQRLGILADDGGPIDLRQGQSSTAPDNQESASVHALRGPTDANGA